MISFEQEFKKFLTTNRITYTDNCNSKTLLDFTIQFNGDLFYVDVKEKRSKYKKHWTEQIPEEFVFIIDEDAVIKSLKNGIMGGIIIRDKRDHSYYFFSNIDLCLMPKTRVKRPLFNGSLRGKWVVDLRNAFHGLVLDDVLEEMRRYLKHDLCPKDSSYKEYYDEVIEERGSVRTAHFMKSDYAVTR